MAALRDSQVSVEALLTDGDPNLRDSQVTVEVLNTSGDPNMRNTQVSVEVLHSMNTMQVAHERAMVLSYPKDEVDNNTMRVAHQRVMVLSKVLYPPSSQVTIIT